MITIITFDGGLGNQMFQYAFYMAYRQRHRFSLYMFNINPVSCHHNGFELFNVFNIQENLKWRFFNLFKYRFNYNYRHFCLIKQKNVFKYSPDYLENHALLLNLCGYWQSEKWFEAISDKIRRKFSFRVDILNSETKELAHKIKLGNLGECCSIHVRRGDYLNLADFKVMDLDYYRKGIQIIESGNKTSCVFLVFSDDLTWCKQTFRKGNFIFVDWNRGSDSWQDMYLMSICHHNIISNSTFSWWGAWLNANPQKKVIAPKCWIGWDPYDIIPEKWIKI